MVAVEVALLVMERDRPLVREPECTGNGCDGTFGAGGDKSKSAISCGIKALAQVVVVVVVVLVKEKGTCH